MTTPAAPPLTLTTAPATKAWLVSEMRKINRRLDKIDFLMVRGADIPLRKLMRMLDADDARLRKLEGIARRMGVKY